MNDFISNAKGFIKNPLSVTALFVTLVYAMACLVINQGLKVASNHLERMWLIQFIVWYPVLLLFVFSWLVMFFPLHLYSPNDFKDESLFLKFLSKKQKDNKLEEEVREMRRYENLDAKRHTLNTEDINVKTMTDQDVKKIVKSIELKALFKLNEKYNVSFAHDVVIGRGKNKRYCDGYANVCGIDYVVEIKHMPVFLEKRCEVLYKTVFEIKSTLDSISVLRNYMIIVCIVYSHIEEAQKKELRERLMDISSKCELVLIDEKDLKIHTVLV